MEQATNGTSAQPSRLAHEERVLLDTLRRAEQRLERARKEVEELRKRVEAVQLVRTEILCEKPALPPAGSADRRALAARVRKAVEAREGGEAFSARDVAEELGESESRVAKVLAQLGRRGGLVVVESGGPRKFATYTTVTRNGDRAASRRTA
jgi:hypothetical protein